MSLHESIRKIAGTDNEILVLVKGTVTAVDKHTDTMTLAPIDGSAEFLDVKLEALDSTSEGRSDFVRYPEIGSYAVIGLLNNDETDTFLIQATRYESVVMIIAKSVKITASGNGAVTVDAQQITFNGGKNNGLVNISPLVAKINKLETSLNNLSASYKGHTHTGVTTGGGVSGPTTASAPGKIQLTKNADIEDTKIKH